MDKRKKKRWSANPASYVNIKTEIERNQVNETKEKRKKPLTIALRYPSCAPNSGVTNCITNASILFLTSGWRIIHGPSAAVMLRAPNFWGAGAELELRKRGKGG
jgi:hypothetical protein